MSRLPLLTFIIVIAALVVGAYLLRPDDEPLRASLSLADALGGSMDGYSRALEPRPFVFPEDHGPHDDFKLEWWYYTGNLATAAGRRFGYEIAVFRTALAPPGTVDSSRASAWATNQLYTAHLAVTDVANERFYSFDRSSRGAVGLAGAQAEPFRVWIGDWEVATAALPDTSNGRTPPMHVQAEAGDVALDLRLRSTKPIVLHGDDGLSRKSDAPGNASYYYSMTRLATTGFLVVEGDTFTVDGRSWMDREWSSSLLDRNQVGWDWFAFHLDDGRDLMFARLRTQAVEGQPYAFGTLVEADGRTRPLDRADIQLEALDTWRSPSTGADYPIEWRVQIPPLDMAFTLTAQIPNQELDVSVRYWEGTVLLDGTANGIPLTGSGYVELTGYADTGG